jgi:MarR family transcriptional regulator, lower aerobic nicotinate degradation pathway regulator
VATAPSTDTETEAPTTTQWPTGMLLGQVSRRYRQVMTERLKNQQWLVDAGFRPPCIGALLVIAARQPLSQRELSDHLWLDPSDLVAVIDILERADFVSRRRDPNDRRRQSLTITPDGRKAAARLDELLRGIDDEVLGPMEAHDRQVLRRLLEGVVSFHLLEAADAAEPAESRR